MKRCDGIGLQLRLGTSITDLAHKALRLELSCFQCFLTVQQTGQSFILKKSDQDLFTVMQKRHFPSLFLHASYMSNLADPCHKVHPRLQHEVRIAEQLGFSHIIIHAGSYPASCEKEEALDAVARSINNILKQTKNLIVVLENVAHGGRAIGGDLLDLYHILVRCGYPKRLHFCLDTAHAHSYGYDIISDTGREAFLSLFTTLCGLERLALIHLNDTARVCGDHVDRHCVIGQGVLGAHVLPTLYTDKRFLHVPCIMEMPELSEHDELSIVRQVAGWRSIKSTHCSESSEIML